jgi:CHASE2 domain-containing sensor protein
MENEPMFWKNLQSILDWLTGSSGGAFVVVSFFASTMLEKFAWWKNIKREVKIAIMLVFSGLLGAGSYALTTNPQLVATIEPYVMPFVYIMALWLTQDKYHQNNKKK